MVWPIMGKESYVHRGGQVNERQCLGRSGIKMVGEKSLSDNVGGVKHFSSTLTHALRRARHFALVEGLAFCSTNQGPLVIVSGQETRSDPSISSVTSSIMITTSNSPLQGSGTPNRYDGELLHTMGISGLSRVSTRAWGPRNFMKITQSRRQNGRGFGAARLISQWRS